MQIFRCLMMFAMVASPCWGQALVSVSAMTPAYSTSLPANESSMPDAPSSSVLPYAALAAGQAVETEQTCCRAFRSVAVEAKLGSGGIGFDIATPLNRFLNLRAGAQFFDHTVGIETDGIHIDSDLSLTNVNVSLDVFPFRHSGFFISPGVSLHNDNHVAGPISIPGGQSFSLGDADYTSDPADPISGFARLRFGNTVAPRLTFGFGNMLPRNGRRFSVPVEVGFEYTAQPVLSLALAGSACSADGCDSINSNDGPQNIQSEVQMIENDLKPLRFFPIAAVGLSYRFGR